MKTVIMAGGLGTRIKALFPDLPKPLIPMKNEDDVEKSVLEWEIEGLCNQGFKDIIITVSYMADKIQDYFGDGKAFNANISYFVEKTPLGNAGALFKIRDQLGCEPFLLLNGDVVFDVDFNRFVSWHYDHPDALVSLFTHPNSHPYDSGLIIADDNNCVIEWLSKEDERPKYYKNRTNSGLHIIDPVILDKSGIDITQVGKIDDNGETFKVDLDRMLLKPLCNTGKMFCYDSPEYVKDMGTPERYYSIATDFKKGIVNRKNLNNKQKAIFLDRDGTINKYVGFLRNIDQLELIDGVSEAIRSINFSEYLCIVITNQPVIARGELTIQQLEEIHNKLETMLGKTGAYLNAIYYCPHHPDKGFKGEIEELKIDCDCRKPKPGLLYKAAEEFNIDLTSSWMIGDSRNDVLAGKNAGCKTCYISSKKEKEIEADLFASDLLSAVNKILNM